MAKILTEEEVNAVGGRYATGSSEYVSNRCCTKARATVLGCNVTSPSPCDENQLVTEVSKRFVVANYILWLITNESPSTSTTYSFKYQGTTYSGTIAKLGWLQDLSTPDAIAKRHEHPTQCQIPSNASMYQLQLLNFTINGINRGTVRPLTDMDRMIYYVDVTNYI